MTTYYRSVSKNPQQLTLSRRDGPIEWAKQLRDKSLALEREGMIMVATDYIDIPYEVWKPLSEDETDFIKFMEQTGGAVPVLIRKR